MDGGQKHRDAAFLTSCVPVTSSSAGSSNAYGEVTGINVWVLPHFPTPLLSSRQTPNG